MEVQRLERDRGNRGREKGRGFYVTVVLKGINIRERSRDTKSFTLQPTIDLGRLGKGQEAFTVLNMVIQIKIGGCREFRMVNIVL